MTLPTQAVSTDVSVAPQLAPEAMAEAAAAGFRSVVNNRPDFEGGPSQPTIGEHRGGGARRRSRVRLAAGRVERAERGRDRPLRRAARDAAQADPRVLPLGRALEQALAAATAAPR